MFGAPGFGRGYGVFGVGLGTTGVVVATAQVITGPTELAAIGVFALIVFHLVVGSRLGGLSRRGGAASR